MAHELNPTAERVEYRMDKRWVLYLSAGLYLLIGLPMSLIQLAVGGLTGWMNGYTKPIDLWSFAVPALVMLGGLVMLWYTRRKLEAGKLVTVLTPEGVSTPPQHARAGATQTPWSQVTRMSVVWVGYGYLIGLGLTDGRVVTISPPQVWRRGDPRLAEALRTFRDHIRRYGGRIDGPVQPPRRPVALLLPLVFFVMLLVGAGVNVATAPFVPPWAPNAAALPPACEALEAAGLDRIWAPSQREPLESDTPAAYDGAARECEATASYDSGTESRYTTITVTTEQYDGGFLESGARRAYHEVASDMAYSSTPVRLGAGDLAYRETPYEGEATVVICRGDVVVTVNVNSAGGDAPTRVAEQLAKGVLSQIEFD